MAKFASVSKNVIELCFRRFETEQKTVFITMNILQAPGYLIISYPVEQLTWLNVTWVNIFQNNCQNSGRSFTKLILMIENKIIMLIFLNVVYEVPIKRLKTNIKPESSMCSLYK